MRGSWHLRFVAVAVCALSAAPGGHAAAQELIKPILPEQRRMEIRHPTQLRPARMQPSAPPATVSRRPDDALRWLMPLDEAIQVALGNGEVVRVLGGSLAANSGRTIYDPAINNALIDQARARFDPRIDVPNTFLRTDVPQGILVPGANPADPPTAIIGGTTVNSFNTSPTIAKDNVLGGTASFRFNATPSRARIDGLPLNPQTSTSAELSYVQPLLAGRGIGPNLAPIAIARIDTERSYFQLKEAVETMVFDVVAAYWSLVFSRTDAWARRQQVVQGGVAFKRAQARLDAGLGNAAEVAQAKSALANFRAAQITAEADELVREAVLRNLLGLPPSDERPIVPTTPASTQRQALDWDFVRNLAEEMRPDLVELKLVIEADEQRLLVAENQAQPRLDAVALYRWNGLEGRTPDMQVLGSDTGQFADWQFGVNFSVPLGLRRERASLRQNELVLARSRANLSQGLHAASHELGLAFRNLDAFYEQYLAYGETREAARVNLERQQADFRAGRRTLYVNVLQAITEWGNAVSLEAQALTRYNSELANLERLTGTILETHGVRFYEERYRSIGPLWHRCSGDLYPRDMRPSPNAERYPRGDRPAEEEFDLTPPIPERVPAAPSEDVPRERPRPSNPEPLPRPAE